MGRFISEDSYWGKDNDSLSLNFYTYCGSDPVNAWDPSGHIIDKYGNMPKKIVVKTKGTGKTTTFWNDTTPPLAKYGVPTIPSSGDIANIVVTTISGTITGTIGSNADKVKKPLTAFENEKGFYQQAADGSIETYTPKINKTVAKVGDIAGKSIAFGTLTLDVANTWTANSGNTNLQRLEKTGVQGASAVASLGVGYVSGTVAAAGIATSEIGIGIPIIAGAVAIDAAGSAAIDWAQNKAYKLLNIK